MYYRGNAPPPFFLGNRVVCGITPSVSSNGTGSRKIGACCRSQADDAMPPSPPQRALGWTYTLAISVPPCKRNRSTDYPFMRPWVRFGRIGPLPIVSLGSRSFNGKHTCIHPDERVLVRRVA